MSSQFQDEFTAAGEQVAADIRAKREARSQAPAEHQERMKAAEHTAIESLEKQFSTASPFPQQVEPHQDDLATQFSNYIRSQH